MFYDHNGLILEINNRQIVGILKNVEIFIQHIAKYPVSIEEITIKTTLRWINENKTCQDYAMQVHLWL